MPTPSQPGQEPTWNHPHPVRWEDTAKSLRVIFNDVVIAETLRGKRVLQTNHPPAYYFPAADVKLDYIFETGQRSRCEWKGECGYFDITVRAKTASAAAWCLFDPTPEFMELAEHYSFSAQQMDACYVDGERVKLQQGNFRGGWITQDFVGLFSGRRSRC